MEKLINMEDNKIIKSKFGLTNNEIKELLKEQKINEKDFYKALGINTCMIINGETITYHTDIDRALRLITNKNK
jgi:DNA-binding transcriptional regulator YiaG